VAAGGSPNPGLWSLVANYNYSTGPTPLVQVSGQNSFTGAQALRVESNGLAGVIALIPQKRFFVRARMQVDAAPLGPVLMALGGQDGNQDHDNELRFRIQQQSWATINIIPGDAVLPQAARNGNCPTCPSVRPNEWMCVEFFADDAAQDAILWIDNVEAARVSGGDGGWPPFPSSPRLRLGSMALQGGQTGVWIDDVAAGPERIGCD
jgi:hypothetical protein